MARDVRLGWVADDPTGLREQVIDLFAGGLLGFGHQNQPALGAEGPEYYAL
jgi:hypothetical protein